MKIDKESGDMMVNTKIAKTNIRTQGEIQKVLGTRSTNTNTNRNQKDEQESTQPIRKLRDLHKERDNVKTRIFT